MSWTLTTSGAAIAKAGVDANSTIVASGSTLAEWSNNSEAVISMLTGKDWVADYASVGTNFKSVLSDMSSDLIAMNIIGYSMGGYTSRLESSTMLDLRRDNFERCLKKLEDKETHKEMV